MNNNHHKEIFIFFVALIMIGATFGGGLIYLKASGKQNSSNLLADAAMTVSPEGTASSSPTAASTSAVIAATTSATTTPPIIVLPKTTTATTTKKKVTATPTAAPAPKPVQKPSVVATGTPTTTAQTTTPETVSPEVTATAAAAATTTVATPAVTPVTTALTANILPYSITTFASGDGWTGWWGSFSKTNDVLTVGGDAKNTGGGALLPGSASWGNYNFQATVNWEKGQTFGLIARYADDKNYVECGIDEQAPGDFQMTLHQDLNGSDIVLAQGDYTDNSPSATSAMAAYIEVIDNQGTCSFNNHVISSLGTGNTINPPYNGEVGFEAWDPKTNNSQIVVTSVDVEPIH